MLRVFRDQKKILSIFLWLVIAAFIGTIFLVWGMGGKTKQANYAIKINGYEISFNEYQSEYENFSNTLKALLGGQVPENFDLEKQVFDSLVEKYLLLAEADKKGVFVSDVEVLHELQQNPAFQTNGKFDPKRYVEILRINGLTPAQYENSVKARLIVDKMRMVIQESVRVSEEEIKNEYIYRNSEAKISYVKIASDKFREKVKFSEKDLKEYYERNKENYRVPEKIKVKYIKIDPKKLKLDIKVSEEEIEKYFLQHADEFHQKEQIAAKHILVRVKNWKDEKEVEAAKKKIEKALKELKQGKKFEDVAKKYSDDVTAEKGGDLGYFSKGQMIKEFEDAVFKLKKGETSKIVKTPVGFHIIKVYDYKPEKKLTLDEAKDQIREKIEQMKEKSAFNEYVLNIYKDILKASNITAYEQENKNVKVYETDYFSMFDAVSPIGQNMDIKNKLFKLQPAEVTNIIDIDGVKYIFELVDKKDSYIPKFDKVKSEVKKDYIDDKAVELAREKASNLLKKYNSIEMLADKERLSITTTPFFKRVGVIPDLGFNADIMNEIFRKKEGMIEKPFEIKDDIYIVSVKKIKRPDFNKITDTEKDELKSFILQVKQEEALNNYVKKLRAEAKIEVNPALNINFKQ